MEDYSQVPYTNELPFDGMEFADNPEPRCACLLLLDKSGSMSTNGAIEELNAGLRAFQKALLEDSLAAKRVEISIVEFGPVRTVTDWITAESFLPPQLVAAGGTPMGEAIEYGVQQVIGRKRLYREVGIQYYRPWIFMITDGGPTDSIKTASSLVQDGEETQQFSFFSVGTSSARFDKLREINPYREPLQLKELRFADLFVWLSSSLRSVSHSTPGDVIVLESPTGPRGWATI